MCNAGAANSDRGKGFQPFLLVHRGLPAPGDPLVQGRLRRRRGGKRLQGWQDEDRTKQCASHRRTKKGGQHHSKQLCLISLANLIKILD